MIRKSVVDKVFSEYKEFIEIMDSQGCEVLVDGISSMEDEKARNVIQYFSKNIQNLINTLELKSLGNELEEESVSYTHLRAHETSLHLVCRLLLEKSDRRYGDVGVAVGSEFDVLVFLMIRRPPRSTHCISSAASDVYKRQGLQIKNRITVLKFSKFSLVVSYRERFFPSFLPTFKTKDLNFLGFSLQE